MHLITSLLVAVAVLLGAAPPAVPAGEPPVGETVDWLIEHVAKCGLTFVRNGREHSPSDAARLMQYKFSSAKKEIHTPEDFIRIAATKSSTTGKVYFVKMADGKLVPSAEWLGEALRKHRAAPAG